jgi:hypothetical protein
VSLTEVTDSDLCHLAFVTLSPHPSATFSAIASLVQHLWSLIVDHLTMNNGRLSHIIITIEKSRGFVPDGIVMSQNVTHESLSSGPSRQ